MSRSALQNKQTKSKQTLIETERTGGCQREEGLGTWVIKVRGLRSPNWWLPKSHEM